MLQGVKNRRGFAFLKSRDVGLSRFRRLDKWRRGKVWNQIQWGRKWKRARDGEGWEDGGVGWDAGN